MKKYVDQLIKWMVLVCIVALPSTQLYADEGTAQTVKSPDPEARSAETQAVQKGAVGAVAETQKALPAREENEADEALSALEKVMSKLSLIVAREPELALAPINEAVVTYDLYAARKPSANKSSPLKSSTTTVPCRRRASVAPPRTGVPATNGGEGL